MLLIFDYDGTVVDMSERWYQLHLDLAQQYELPIVDKKIYLKAKADGVHEEVIMQAYSRDSSRIKAYNKERIALIEDKKYLAFDQAFDNIFNALRAWGKLGDMYLLSKRKSSEHFYWSVNKLGLNTYFKDCIPTGGKEKEEVLKELFSPKDLAGAISISDAYEDYTAGTALGMRCLAVNYGCRSAAFFESKGIFDSISDCYELEKRCADFTTI